MRSGPSVLRAPGNAGATRRSADAPRRPQTRGVWGAYSLRSPSRKREGAPGFRSSIHYYNRNSGTAGAVRYNSWREVLVEQKKRLPKQTPLVAK